MKWLWRYWRAAHHLHDAARRGNPTAYAWAEINLSRIRASRP